MTRLSALLARPHPVLALCLIYFLVMWLQLGTFLPGGRSDDVEAMLYSQVFQWGYILRNPPLFDWIALAVMELTGPRVEVVFGLRMGALFLMVSLLYLVAQRVQSDPLLAAAAGLSVITSLHFHWYALIDLTHSVLAGALMPLAVLVLMALGRSARTRDFVLIGVVVAAGILAKYTFVLFALAMLGAAALNPGYRRLLTDRRMPLAIAISVALVLPHGLWVLSNAGHVAETAEHALGAGWGDSYLESVAAGMNDLVASVGTVLVLPIGLILLLFYPSLRSASRTNEDGRDATLGHIRRGRPAPCPPDRPRPAGEADVERATRERQERHLLASAPPHGTAGGGHPLPIVETQRQADLRLIRDIVLAMLVLLVVAVLLGASRIRPHHLFFLTLAPVWVFGIMDRRWVAPWRMGTYLGLTLAILLVSALSFAPRSHAAERACRACGSFLPYATYAEVIRALGYEGGTVYYRGRHRLFHGAMLRAELPDSRFLSPDVSPQFRPPGRAQPGDCLILWLEPDHEDFGRLLLEGGELPEVGLPLPAQTAVRSLVAPMVLTGTPAPRLYIAYVPGGLGTCR